MAPTQQVDFDLRQLEIFRKVVELGSFSKAAKAVFLAQASVSERIATLESLVGTRLLDRLGRTVVPTKAGEILYKHAVLLLDMKEAARMEMEHFLGLEGGEVHLGGSTIPGEYILPKLLVAFCRKYPSILLALTIGDSAGIQRQVLEGALELGVIGSRTPDRRLHSWQLWKDELVIAVPTDHPLADSGVVSLGALAREPFILREAGSGTLDMVSLYLEGLDRNATERLRPVARMGTSTAVKEAVKSGLGISILSIRAIESEIAAGQISALRIEGMTMARNFSLVRDRRRVASPACLAMTEFLLATSSM